jgi:hypothetical protein
VNESWFPPISLAGKPPVPPKKRMNLLRFVASWRLCVKIMIAHLHRSESEFISEDDFFFLCAAAPLRD